MHMTVIPDARFDNPLLDHAFDISPRSIIKARDTLAKAAGKLYKPRYRGRERTLLANRGSPFEAKQRWRPRNVSEPQLVSSTNCMRESWLTNFPSARTVGDIAHLSIDDDIGVDAIRHSQSVTVIYNSPDSLPCQVDDECFQKTHRTFYDDSCDISRDIEQSGDTDSEEESLYSMDSADQEVHPLLLSMPVIPQIKLERKATVRKPDLVPLLDDARNRTFLSPRIRDLRTPLRMSSRRYGRVLPQTSPPVDVSGTSLAQAHDHNPPTSKGRSLSGSASRSDRLENREEDLEIMHPISEPTSNVGYPSDEREPLSKQEIDKSTHSDTLRPSAEEVNTSPEPSNDGSESCAHEPLEAKQVYPRRTKHGHQRSSLAHSISLSSILHAVADGRTCLDTLLRKPKKAPEAAAEPRFEEPVTKVGKLSSKWAPENGQIIIKVFVPSTDDIWMFRVPQDIGLAGFTSRVTTKLGFAVSFSGSLWDEPKYHFRTDKQFVSWTKGRVRFGRNLPIVAHAGVLA